MENGEVTSVRGVANPLAQAHQPGQIPGFIRQQKADVILSGGMGGRAIEFFLRRPASRSPPAQAARCVRRWRITSAVS